MTHLDTNRSVIAVRGHGRGREDQLVAAVALAWRTHKTRRALAEMSDRQLADIGLSRPAALAEAARLPWDVQPTRRMRHGSSLWSAMRQTFARMRASRMVDARRPGDVSWNG